VPEAPASGGAQLTFVLGGARSGKSRYAESLVTAQPPHWFYLATAEALDDEMARRIAEHRAGRDAGWQTIEAPRGLAKALDGTPDGAPILVDCLTLWLSNLLIVAAAIDQECDGLEQALSRRRGLTVLVANEVGLGIVPDNALARQFRDAAGRLNQRIAVRASQVIFLAAGIPLKLK
jgi:adenosylcobinamide kinase / adenosylcobinamide-phosphate guanylyltransferase